MNISVWRQKFQISLLSVITWIGFVVVFGVFWGYAFLLKDKHLSTQEREVQYLREENRQLVEQNRELERRIEALQAEKDSPQENITGIPDTDPEFGQASQRSFIYTVKQGDTIWDIARLYNVDNKDLMRWNNLVSSQISPGDQLIIILDENE